MGREEMKNDLRFFRCKQESQVAGWGAPCHLLLPVSYSRQPVRKRESVSVRVRERVREDD